MEPNVTDCPSNISIIGTGEFARALATRLHDNGVSVIIGSRFPSKRQTVPEKDILRKVKVVSIQECVQSSDVIVVAVHPEHHVTLKPLERTLAGKILIDVSNSRRAEKTSNTEKLAGYFPGSHIVKAFNTVSAHTLEIYTESNRPVYVCGENPKAKRVTMQLASRLGYSAVDSGGLAASSRVEQGNRQLLPGWGWPTIVLLIVFVIWFVYTLCRYYKMRSNPYTWERLPTNVFNKIFGVVSITLLALVYIPGCIAAFKQLANGTKQKRFHKSLDRWLKMRKHLGLYALLFGTLHAVFSMSILTPAYFSKWFLKSSVTVQAGVTVDTKVDIASRMNWIGETNVLLGMMAIFSMALLGFVSIPSIANSLNWREWQCMQSYMGFVCLLLSAGHVTVKGATSWVNETYKEILPSMAFLSLLLPWFALALRFILLWPCVFLRLKKIRRGWTKNNDPEIQIQIESNGTSAPPSEKDGIMNGGFHDTTF